MKIPRKDREKIRRGLISLIGKIDSGKINDGHSKYLRHYADLLSPQAPTKDPYPCGVDDGYLREDWHKRNG